MSSVLATYRDLVDHPEALEAACRRPLPETVWMHPDRRAAAALSTVSMTPIGWHPHAWRLHAPRNDSFRHAYLLGGWHIQEESALSAVQVLNPAPGEQILDLCAAPGNKTAELALRVGITGTVIANDVSRARAGVIQTTMNRLGLVNVAVSIQDGTRYPAPDNSFDAVLVDAPCSCEGTCRRHPDVLYAHEDHDRHRALQIRLLSEAIRLVRPHGRVCYATCTFAPEENEEVLHHVLTERGDCDLEPVAIPGFQIDPGIDSWQGRTYHPSVRKAARIWPHRNDTGGFFVALLRKAPSLDRPQERRSAIRPILTEEPPWSFLDLPTGIRDTLGWLPGHKYDRLVSARMYIPEGLPVAAQGIPGRNLKFGDKRLSTAAALFLARQARDGWVEIEPADIPAFIRRDSVTAVRWTREGHRMATVLTRSGDIALGLAEPLDASRVQSMFPKVWGGAGTG